ncbi:hypothetical protein Taro_037665 [Colocasia esculenta]|uniref:Uncharacterized protein n=1 Tax=Colocasia esculenta TaxID=4460 RepID=A0A843W4R5_COLES|nr:hypothetical protein [Colocasia esculenta]
MAYLSASGALLCLLLSIHLFILSSSAASDAQSQHRHLTRKLQFSEDEQEEQSLLPPPKKKSSSSSATTAAASKAVAEGKNQSKLLKPTKPKKSNSTAGASDALLSNSGLNKTLASGKLPKASNSTKLLKASISTKLLKASNSTKLLNPPKAGNATATAKVLKSPKAINSTASVAAKPSKKLSDLPPAKANKTQSANPKPKQQQQSSKSKAQPDRVVPWYETALDDPTEEETDLVAEFRDLPSKFHQTLLPDLEKFSTTSKVYLSRANKEITRGVKPIVGNRYAPTVASVTSALFLVLPLLLVAALLHQVRTYLSLPRILLFVHAYLAIYFSILSLTAVLTGLEPLRLFHATSPGPYVYTQVLQTLGYVLFLLLQLMHLIVVFATASSSSAAPEGAAARALALGQLVVGLAVGLHYYTAVFHRAVVGEPPRTNWRVHGLYAACFISICAFARAAERRKKAYLMGGPGSDVGKKS